MRPRDLHPLPLLHLRTDLDSNLVWSRRSSLHLWEVGGFVGEEGRSVEVRVVDHRPAGGIGVSDGRRRRWIPLSVEFPFDKTGTHLQEQYGAAGLGAWVALLTAAKRAPVQGTFSYTTEAEAWERLGIIDPPCPFGEFITFTGRIKKTRKRRRGRITDVQITGWEQWNNTQKTRPGREETPRSEADIRSLEDAYESESDSESEIEIDESNPFFDFWKRRLGSQESP